MDPQTDLGVCFLNMFRVPFCLVETQKVPVLLDADIKIQIRLIWGFFSYQDQKSILSYQDL